MKPRHIIYRKIITSHKVVDCVPYQKCPLCDGIGQVLQDGFTNGFFKTCTTCTTCSGSKIIPMHILNKDICYEIKKSEINFQKFNDHF